MPIQPDGEAPYNSAPATITIIEKFRAGTLQTPVTLDVLRRAGIPESLVHRTIKALRTLELLDENGHPTEQFQVLARTRPDEYKDAFAGYLRSVYKDVFTYTDPADGDLDAITNAFWGYKPLGQRETMVRLFLGLCEYAGLIPEQKRERPAPSPRKGKGGTAATAKSSTAKSSAAKGTGQPSDNGSGTAGADTGTASQNTKPAGGDSQTIILRSGGTVTLTVSVNLFQLSPSDREFVLKLIDEMSAYQQKAEQPQTT